MARGIGIGERFLSGKGFGCDDKQRGFRMHFIQRIAQLGAVDVRHKVHTHTRVAEGFQRRTHHQRAQIRTADADVYHIGNHLIGVTQPIAVAHGMGEFAHALEHIVHFRHHVFAVHLDRRIGTIAQSHMQYGAVFGFVDFLTGKHRFFTLLHTGLFGQLYQPFKRFISDAVFGIIQFQTAHFQPIAFGTIRILFEQFAHVHLFGARKMIP